MSSPHLSLFDWLCEIYFKKVLSASLGIAEEDHWPDISPGNKAVPWGRRMHQSSALNQTVVQDNHAVILMELDMLCTGYTQEVVP
jgi:hypothetical protein